MYESFYGFREPAFELTSNPRFLFLTAQHREALCHLEYGLSSAKPITVLIGDAGTGKSTLLRAALQSEMCRHVNCVFIDNPTLTRHEFVETLAARFDLGANALASKASMLTALETVIRRRHERGEITALVVDEAQALPREIFEEIRLLANMETPTQKLLPVVLAGQPELAERLNERGLRQLKQRIALRCELKPLDLSDTAAYIASRIRTAGGDPANIFTRQAVTLIHEHSHGLPRLISVICDNALTSGFALDQRPVDGHIVLEVCQDFDLKAAAELAPQRPAVPPPAPPPAPKPAQPQAVTTAAPQPAAPEKRDDAQPKPVAPSMALQPVRALIEARSATVLGLS
jgi:general secretion pathway protein A